MVQLNHTWLVRKRPHNPSLVCCNYNTAEENEKAGIPGPRKWGGTHLCEECLGIDYPDSVNEEGFD